VNAKAQDDATALSFAVHNSHVDVCKELISSGANAVWLACCVAPVSRGCLTCTTCTDLQNVFSQKNRKSVLMTAAQKGNVEVSEVSL
jgi:ankyrin repeat protein